MSKFLFNASNVYTLLFRGGSVEIKPLKYVKVEDSDFPGIFQSAVESNQVLVFEKESDVPEQASAAPVEMAKLPVFNGLTADQLKEELALRDKDKKPLESIHIGRHDENEVKPPRNVDTTSIGVYDEKDVKPKTVATTTSIGIVDAPVVDAPVVEIEEVAPEVKNHAAKLKLQNRNK